MNRQSIWRLIFPIAKMQQKTVEICIQKNLDNTNSIERGSETSGYIYDIIWN